MWQALAACLRNECVNTRKEVFQALAQDRRLPSPRNYRPEKGCVTRCGCTITGDPGDHGDHLAGLKDTVVPEVSFLHIVIIIIVIIVVVVIIIIIIIIVVITTTNHHNHIFSFFPHGFTSE